VGPLTTVPLASALLLSLPAGSGEGADQRAIDAAIERGVAHLLETQELDGSWIYQGGRPRPGCNALCVYALVKSGVAARHNAVRRAIANLETSPPAMTYDVACLLLALTALDQPEHAGWIERLVRQLMAWQEQGDFGYPGGADLSNTQYAALGLWAAARDGAEVPREVWEDLAAATLEYAQEDGGFAYRKELRRVLTSSSAATGSMTTAGVGVLAICAERLERAGGAPRKLGQRVERATQRGLDWIERNFSVVENPPGRGHLAYYLYGLERVGALAGVTHFGRHDWYREGAEHLVRSQAREGHWGGRLGAGPEQTAFCLLFLRRATNPVTGGGSRPTQRHYASVAAGAPLVVAASGDSPLSLWVATWDADLRSALEWPGERGRGPRVIRVVYRADGAPIETVQGDPARPAGDERFAARHEFERSGRYSISAQVQVTAPPSRTADGRERAAHLRVLEAPPFAVEIGAVTPQWMLDDARAPGLNLLPAAGARVEASSTWRRGPSVAAGAAVDNLCGTCWLADPDDERPTLTIRLSRATRADTVLLSHARSRPFEPGAYARAVAALVSIDGEPAQRVALCPDERRKAVLRLPRPRAIQTLEIALPWRVPGAGGQCAVGLSEVELQLRR